VNARVLIAFGFGLIGAVAAGLIWYLVLLVLAPYRQRDDARASRVELITKLDKSGEMKELLDAIGERLRLGSELKEFAEHLHVGQYEREFLGKFSEWDDANVELLERLAPGFVPDYRFAEESPELFETRQLSQSYSRKYLPAPGEVEVKLRSLRAIRGQLRAREAQL
jgi:hypothetical protein